MTVLGFNAETQKAGSRCQKFSLGVKSGSKLCHTYIEFVLCHTYNGKIRMKKSARKNGDLSNDDKDEGIGDWITITSPDDVFKHDINIDFEKLDYLPLKII